MRFLIQIFLIFETKAFFFSVFTEAEGNDLSEFLSPCKKRKWAETTAGSYFLDGP